MRRHGLSFRGRVVVLLAAAIGAVQAFNAVAQYWVVRNAVLTRTGTELARAAEIFNGRVQVATEQLGETARILSLDFALREAVATGEHETALSALRNYGQRLNGARMLLVSLDGHVMADSQPPPSGPAASFAYRSLLGGPALRKGGTALAVLDGQPSRLAYVPVLAPRAVGWVVAVLPLGAEDAAALKALSPVDIDVSFVWQSDDGWRAAGTSLDQALAATIPATAAALEPAVPMLRADADGDAVQYLGTFPVAAGSPPVGLLLRHRADTALEAYEPLVYALLGVILTGLAAGLGGGVLAARTAARPLGQLAKAARDVEAGRYDLPTLAGAEPAVPADEVGRAMQAFRQMAGAVSDRERQVRHQAAHDGVTGLPNRQELDRLLAERAGQGAAPLSIVLLGLARLAELNNTLGHGLGDRLVARVGDLLRDAAGPGALVARVADNRFAVALPAGEEQAAEAARRLVGVFDAPVALDGLAIDVQAGAGVAGRDPALTPRELLRRADVALYLALQHDHGVTTYAPGLDPYRPEDVSLMSELRAGVERGEMALRYQPKVDLRGGRVVGAEALARWTHPRHGFLPPDRFIPLAEETGNIRHLTRWALSTALAQAAAWRTAGLDLGVAVNVSARDLADAGMADLVRGLMGDLRLPPRNVTVEVTEGAVMRDPDAAVAVLRRMADAGARVSVDDFGTGHSSLAYLRKLPVSELKVDKSFVLKLASSPTDQAVVKAVVELGHALDLSVVAEGVEDAGAFALLAGMGCDLAQGYHMGRPMPAADLAALAVGARWDAVPA